MTAVLRAYVSGALTGVDGLRTRRLYELAGRALREAGFEPYLPHLRTDPVAHPDVKPAAVYRADRAEVATSDLAVVYMGRPSLGVGQELEIAAAALVPVLPIAARNERISRMALGGPARMYGPIIFDSEEELAESLARLLPEIGRELLLHERAEMPPIGDRLRRLRTQTGLTTDELARRLRVAIDYLDMVESANPLVSNPSLAFLTMAARELGSTLAHLISGVDSPMLQSLRDYAVHRGLSFTEYEDLQHAALVGGRPSQVLSFDDWDRVRDVRALTLVGAEQLELPHR